MCVAGIAEAFVYNKILLAILRVIYGIGGQGIVLASFVLAAESTLPKYSVVITTLPGTLPQFDYITNITKDPSPKTFYRK